MSRWTAADVRNVRAKHLQQPVKAARSKHGNQKVWVDNIEFDSKKEAARYNELKLLIKAGRATVNEADWIQPCYPIRVREVFIGNFHADFRWTDVETGMEVVEDVKSPSSKTEAYQLRKKLVEAIYGITIRET